MSNNFGKINFLEKRDTIECQLSCVSLRGFVNDYNNGKQKTNTWCLKNFSNFIFLEKLDSIEN